MKIPLSKRTNEQIELSISKRALSVLVLVPSQEKEAPKSQRRLIRIRRNLFRELEALNKEVKRHRPKVQIL